MVNLLFILTVTFSYAHNDDSHEAHLVRNIQYLNNLSGGSKDACFGAKELANEVSQDQKLKEQLCSTLETYTTVPASRKLKFDESDPKNICSTYWKDGKSPFLRNKDKALVSNGKGITTVGVEYKAPTRKEVMDQGYAMGTEDQLRDLGNEARGQIAEVSAICCDGNEVCKTAMSNVKIKICKDDQADQDSSKTDGCFAHRTSFFTNAYGREEHVSLIGLLGDAVKNYDRLDFERAYDASPTEVEWALKLTGNKKATKPVSGAVVLAPYFVNGQPYSRFNLTHELAHACSSIRRQTLILQSDKEAKRLAESFVRQSIAGECKLNYSMEVAYQKVLSPIDAKGDLSACILDMTKASTVESSSVYSPEACLVDKMEESAAEAISMALHFKKGPIVPGLYPIGLCHSVPSNKHAHTSELAKCLLLKSPQMLATARAHLACQGKK